MNAIDIHDLGDRTLLIRLGDDIDAATNVRVHALADHLRAARLAGIVDIVPAYASIAVHYDPLVWFGAASDRSPGDCLAQRLRALLAPIDAGAHVDTVGTNDAPVDIPVCYGGDVGPDLADVARHAGLDAHDVVARHIAGDYRVAMLGFAPGFPYLLGLAPSLHMPRRANPRTRVPAGSVAIGGAQTGIYPRELPGGWQIIGRTPLCLFDAAREPPSLLAAGQRVRFRAIDAEEFRACAERIADAANAPS